MTRLLVLVLAVAGCNSILGVHEFGRRDASGGDDDASDAPPATDALVDVMPDAPTEIYQQAYIKASNTRVNLLFGWSTALSSDGSTLAVSAFRDNSAATGIDGDQTDISAPNAGAVYVFVRSGNTWTQQAYVKPSNTASGDLFGNSLSLSADGSRLAVGAREKAGNGAAFVFKRTGTTWAQEGALVASNAGNSDWFGYQVAISGDGTTVAVGAPNEDSSTPGINPSSPNDNASNSGAVYVFYRSLSTWSQQAYLKAITVNTFDNLGWSVALSNDGNTLAAGATYYSNQGAVLVYSRSGTTWSQIAHVTPQHPVTNGEFGVSVALSSDAMTLAVGEDGEASNATGIDGNQLDTSAMYAGAAFVFSRSGTAFNQQAYVKSPLTSNGDLFGSSVALSGDGSLLAVTSMNEGGTGAAFVYSRTGTTWMTTKTLTASNADPGDNFGCTVSISADAAWMAVGAYDEDSMATGVNGSQANDSSEAGAAYVFGVP